MTLAEFANARDLFRRDCVQEYRIMPPTMTVIDTATALLERHSLRAYDAVHVATALSAQQFLSERGYPELTFLCADDRLNQIAITEGLATDNPASFHTAGWRGRDRFTLLSKR
ncbi:MAG: type II toxin-antitoxin system VapC family toxin [Proteobacteria bacterium]|nr:type II toxin-antitoxin system VapC family toxin [Pseudomonadota bacterium]